MVEDLETYASCYEAAELARSAEYGVRGLVAETPASFWHSCFYCTCKHMPIFHVPRKYKNSSKRRSSALVSCLVCLSLSMNILAVQIDSSSSSVQTFSAGPRGTVQARLSPMNCLQLRQLRRLAVQLHLGEEVWESGRPDLLL